MTDPLKQLDARIRQALQAVTGIVSVRRLDPVDGPAILNLEQDAESRSLMGMGSVVNTGVRDVLGCERIYAALTGMDFDWGCHASLVLKKGEEVVGEEVRDPSVIQKLTVDDSVWFLHRNFVIYKDRIRFPQDIVKKNCRFELPSLPADWCAVHGDPDRPVRLIYCNPSTPGDLFIKARYFQPADEKGLGTILVGLRG